jgi:hypothetical protein
MWLTFDNANMKTLRSNGILPHFFFLFATIPMFYMVVAPLAWVLEWEWHGAEFSRNSQKTCCTNLKQTFVWEATGILWIASYCCRTWVTLTDALKKTQYLKRGGFDWVFWPHRGRKPGNVCEHDILTFSNFTYFCMSNQCSKIHPIRFYSLLLGGVVLVHFLLL